MSITDLNEALDKAERGILNFFLPRLLPGDPVAYLTGFAEEDMTPAQVQQVIDESAVDYAPAPYEYADGKLTVKTELVTNDLAFIRIVKAIPHKF